MKSKTIYLCICKGELILNLSKGLDLVQNFVPTEQNCTSSKYCLRIYNGMYKLKLDFRSLES